MSGIRLPALNKKSRANILIFMNERLLALDITDIAVEIILKEIVNEVGVQKMFAGRLRTDVVDHCLYWAVNIAEYPCPPAELLIKMGKRKFNMPFLQLIQQNILPVLGYEQKKFPFKDYADVCIKKANPTEKTKETFYKMLNFMLERHDKTNRTFKIGMIAGMLYVASQVEDDLGIALSQKKVMQATSMASKTVRTYASQIASLMKVEKLYEGKKNQKKAWKWEWK